MHMTVEYPTPKNLLLEDDPNFARTEDGKFYARVSLGFLSSTRRQVEFLLYVQLSEADWNALRDGTAKFVTGRIENHLFIDEAEEFSDFRPTRNGASSRHAADTMIDAGPLDRFFDSLAFCERKGLR